MKVKSSKIVIVPDDLTGQPIIDLLHTHAAHMAEGSPPESVHTLSIDDLRKPGIAFYSAWINDELAGCIGMQELTANHAEIKSTHTVAAFRGHGVAVAMLDHLITTAVERGYSRLSLETGTDEQFLAARKLYERFEFVTCPPFGDYVEDPYSVFMTRELMER